MRIRRLLLPALAAAACLLAPAASAQHVGSTLPGEVVSLVGWTGLPVQSFDELAGRAVLIEFFAYW